MMKRLPFSVFLAVVMTLILSSVTASAQQPRAVPPNDNFVGAIPIEVGKSYTVLDISAATNQVGEPTASCKSGAVIPHSVWFSVTQPRISIISLSTFGSVLADPVSHVFDTVLAVYELTSPGVFTERACNDDSSGLVMANLTFAANANTTYYIVAGTFSTSSFLPESTLKLNTRMMYTAMFPPNFSFETPVNGTDWKLKNGGDDAVACSNPTYPAAHGACVFRFTGTPGVTTKLTLTTPFFPTFLPRKNAFVAYLIYFRVLDTVALGTAKIRFIVSYTDGTPPTIQTVDLTGTPGSASYTSRFFSLALKSRKVAAIKFEVKFASETGTMLLDFLDYTYLADQSTRRSRLLPMPPAAQ